MNRIKLSPLISTRPTLCKDIATRLCVFTLPNNARKRVKFQTASCHFPDAIQKYFPISLDIQRSINCTLSDLVLGDLKILRQRWGTLGPGPVPPPDPLNSSQAISLYTDLHPGLYLYWKVWGVPPNVFLMQPCFNFPVHQSEWTLSQQLMRQSSQDEGWIMGARRCTN